MSTKYNFRGQRYTYTNQRQLRAAFFEMCDELGIDTRGKKTRFDLTLNIAYNDWLDSLHKDAAISDALAYRACLY